VSKDDNLPPFYAVVTKSGNINFLETFGPVQACNGTDLPFIHEEIKKKKKSGGISSSCLSFESSKITLWVARDGAVV
jgi:hypothetical protein